MGMRLTTYIITGFKTDRKELEFRGIDYWEIDNHNVDVIMSEGSDAVVVGKVIATSSGCEDAKEVELEFPSVDKILADLSNVGIFWVSQEDIKNYMYAAWG